MGQQPNIEVDPSDAPRLEAVPPPPRRWVNDRPGAIQRPEDQPHGGAFGHPAPDAGFALKLIRRADWDRAHRPKGIEAVLTTMVVARASHWGRAPVPEDVEAALTLLGLRPDGLSAELLERLIERRERALDHAAHEHVKGTYLLEELDPDLLVAPMTRLPALLATR